MKVKFRLWFALSLLLFLTGCPGSGSTGEKGEAPPEAKFFENLSLASPLKSYRHHNPIMTQNFGADPWALAFGDRVYVYMTGDTPRLGADGVIQQNNYDNITTIRVLSSSDLVNWTEHPAIAAAGPQGAAKWAARSWAPAAAFKEIGGQAKFFLYFANGANGIGVLQADSPAGPFTDPIGGALVNSSTPNCGDVVWLFDPAVLTDDDGKAYLYFGGGTPTNTGQDLWGGAAHSNHPSPGTIRAVELGADMASLAGTPVRLDVPFSFEDSGINKIGNTYYYSYCTNRGVDAFAANDPAGYPDAVKIGKGMSIAYMTGENPLGPFALQGMILANPGEMFGIRGGNNHHAMFEFRGKWYIAYHSRLLAQMMGLDDDGKPSAAGEGYRITHIDAVNIKEDGTISLINGTRNGVAQSGNFDPYQPVDAATIGVMAGISTGEYQPPQGGPSAAPRMMVTDIHPGCWLALYGVDFGSGGAKKFKCLVSPPPEGFGMIQIKLDSLDGKPVGYVKTEAGQAGEITVDLLETVTAVHDLVFVFYGEGWDFIQWQFLQ